MLCTSMCEQTPPSAIALAPRRLTAEENDIVARVVARVLSVYPNGKSYTIDLFLAASPMCTAVTFSIHAALRATQPVFQAACVKMSEHVLMYQMGDREEHVQIRLHCNEQSVRGLPSDLGIKDAQWVKLYD